MGMMEDSPPSKYDSVKVLKYRDHEYKLKVNSIPDYMMFPLDNGGMVPVGVDALFKPKYAELRSYFYEHQVLPVEIVNPILNQMGIGSINTNNIDEDDIICRTRIDEMIQAWFKGDSRGAKFIGDKGTGKTTTVAYIVREALTKSGRIFAPKDIRFYDMSEIITAMLDYKTYPGIANKLKCRILIIDEFLQAENVPPQVFDKFHAALNERQKTTWHITIVCSNRSRKYISDNYPLLGSRLSDESKYHDFFQYLGDDKRQRKDQFKRDLPDYSGLINADSWEQWSYMNYVNSYKPNR